MKTATAVLLALALPAAAQFRFTKSDESLELHDGDTQVAGYRTDYRFPYIHPLVSPSGANITRHWPMSEVAPSEDRDHPHHRGLWLAHGAVNGFDFWHGADALITHRGFVGQEQATADNATFTVDLSWEAGGKTHLTEKRQYQFRKADEKTLVVEVTCSLTAADGEVVFGDTKEGTFALRMDRTLRLKGKEAKSKLLNSEGLTDAGIWGKRASWVSTHGPDERGEPAVIAMLEHPTSFRHPTWWHARDYGLFAANAFGVNDFEKKNDPKAGEHILKQGETLTLRFAIVVHHGTMEGADINGLWQEFSKQP
jgi:hypothetical protein